MKWNASYLTSTGTLMKLLAGLQSSWLSTLVLTRLKQMILSNLKCIHSPSNEYENKTQAELW